MLICCQVLIHTPTFVALSLMLLLQSRMPIIGVGFIIVAISALGNFKANKHFVLFASPTTLTLSFLLKKKNSLYV